MTIKTSTLLLCVPLPPTHWRSVASFHSNNYAQIALKFIPIIGTHTHIWTTTKKTLCYYFLDFLADCWWVPIVYTKNDSACCNFIINFIFIFFGFVVVASLYYIVLKYNFSCSFSFIINPTGSLQELNNTRSVVFWSLFEIIFNWISTCFWFFSAIEICFSSDISLVFSASAPFILSNDHPSQKFHI